MDRERLLHHLVLGLVRSSLPVARRIVVRIWGNEVRDGMQIASRVTSRLALGPSSIEVH